MTTNILNVRSFIVKKCFHFFSNRIRNGLITRHHHHQTFLVYKTNKSTLVFGQYYPPANESWVVIFFYRFTTKLYTVCGCLHRIYLCEKCIRYIRLQKLNTKSFLRSFSEFRKKQHTNSLPWDNGKNGVYRIILVSSFYLLCHCK